VSTADINMQDNQAQTAANRRQRTAQDPIPRQIGKYHIKRKIGEGGMGTVYLAVDHELKRTVALKVLPTDKSRNQTLVKRFKSEAQAAAQLTHEHIVRVYDAGESNGRLYIAFEYVDGIDVFQLLSKRGRLSVKRAIEIVKQVAKALEHAHSKLIVHRDIKPSNLLIRKDGTVKVTDLGLARSIDENSESGITRAGMTVGTVDYMAPEQAVDSKAADIRSDIYSLGCTFYQLLTGAPPYTNNSLTSKLHAHATEAIPNPRLKNEAVPEAVLAVLQRMMAKRPEDRYQTPADLLKDLEHQGLQRSNVQDNILAELAADDALAKLPPRSRSNATPAAPPPRANLKQDQNEDNNLIHFDNWQVVKSIVLISMVVGFICWLSTLFSQASHTFTIPNAPDKPQQAENQSTEGNPNQIRLNESADPESGRSTSRDASQNNNVSDDVYLLKIDTPRDPLVAPKPKKPTAQITVIKPSPAPDKNPSRKRPDF